MRCSFLSRMAISGRNLTQHTADVWIIMDYAASGSVLDVMKAIRRPLREAEIGAILTPIVSGLNYLHSSGVIHRDIKSANILLTERMNARLADFGAVGSVESMVTKRKTIIGTPLFMPPEVRRRFAPVV